ncbi:hypothetical protein, partial [Raoultella planticola]|uniref:hypothetical protein n=1 Tax=Raoultella planticola TaxID=575 RepID=UPI00197DBFA3
GLAAFTGKLTVGKSQLLAHPVTHSGFRLQHDDLTSRTYSHLPEAIQYPYLYWWVVFLYCELLLRESGFVVVNHNEFRYPGRHSLFIFTPPATYAPPLIVNG